MSVYRHVVLRESNTGTYFARVDPSDYGYSNRTGAGGVFDTAVLPAVITAIRTEVLPAVITAIRTELNCTVNSIWVDDASGDGWDSLPPGTPPPDVPWDGPASLFDEPELPYVVASAETTALSMFGRDVLRIAPLPEHPAS